MRLTAPQCVATPPRMAWFMCLTPATDAQALKHLDYVKAAIISARLNAPSLAPYIIWVSESTREHSFHHTVHVCSLACGGHSHRSLMMTP